MEEKDFDLLYDAYYSKLQDTDTAFVRYLYNQINWDARMIGIIGARGVGKTTLLMQRIKLEFGPSGENAFYASLDNLWFNDNSLIDLVAHLLRRGVKHLFIDEVHKYPNWIQTLKNIYDMYPQMNIVYTGSSIIEIDHSVVDMSRRQTLYRLRCMSFREFLEYERVAVLQPVSFEDVLKSHVAIAMEISAKVDVLVSFSKYLEYGCYPFYKSSGKDFMVHLRESARLVIESDVAAVEPFEYQTLEKMKKMLMIMAKQIPFSPNIRDLSAEISTNRNLSIKMLYLLDKAEILRLVTEKMKTYKNLIKPEKVLFNNTNLMHAFTSNPSVGTMRETFFTSQAEYAGYITSPRQGDFYVDDTFLFEVGGPTKSFDQIKDVPNSYLAVDNTLIGRGNRIPLWLFGMMY